MTADVAIENTVYKIGGFSVDRNIVRCIRDASDISGVSFDYMMAKAGHESRFEADASALRSSAEGIYQFTTETWLQQMKLHGAKYGYAKLAASIYRDSRGRYRVKDKKTREKILSLRRSPRISALLAAEFAKSNQKILEDQVGGEISPADLYLAHFMGPSGAVMLMRADKFTPHKLAADLFPDAAMANPPIFYNEKNKMRTVRQVRQVLADIFQDKIERFAVLPGSLKVWLDQQSPSVKVKERKPTVVVEAPVLRIETTATASLQDSPPIPKLPETFQLAKILPGEGFNLDDEEALNQLKEKHYSFKGETGKDEKLSADFHSVTNAVYDVAGITGIEADIPGIFHPVYTFKEATLFETDDYMISGPLPVAVTAQATVDVPFNSSGLQETR